jgi:hypothetical protein
MSNCFECVEDIYTTFYKMGKESTLSEKFQNVNEITDLLFMGYFP